MPQRFSTTQYLVLMKDGTFIDTARLTVGLYGSNIPTLYPEGTSIAELVERAESVEHRGVEVGSYIENVMKCQLVPATLLIEPV
jgi:hypothetical protein